MKNVLLLCLCLLFFLLPIMTHAGEIDLKPYGFIKGDMVYATKGVYSWGDPANNYLSAPHFASGVEHAASGFTVQHTRFGLKGSAGDKIKISGVLELDFYNGAFDSNAKPRMRLAYMSMVTGQFEFRFGQQWDIFSPINATTTNTSGNLWYAGNKGGRRTQIQGWFRSGKNNISPILQLSIGEAAKETSGLGEDNLSNLPMLQGRLSAQLLDRHTLGVFAAYAKFSPNPNDSNEDYFMKGFGVDIFIKFNSKLILKGEFNTGTNLRNANLFSAVGSGSKNNERKSTGLWFNILAYPSGLINLVAGFGMDKSQSDVISDREIKQNTSYYGDFIFPIVHGFSLTLELQNISTQVQNGETNSAFILNFSGRVDF